MTNIRKCIVHVLFRVKKCHQRVRKLAALDEIDLKVKKGEILGIVGPNGSGKTTLINVISGYYRPTKGKIFFNGKKISGLRPDQIAKLGIIRTFQSNVLYEGTTVVESMLISSYQQYSTKNWQSFLETKAWKDDNEKVVGRVIELVKLLDLLERHIFTGGRAFTRVSEDARHCHGYDSQSPACSFSMSLPPA